MRIGLIVKSTSGRKVEKDLMTGNTAIKSWVCLLVSQKARRLELEQTTTLSMQD